MRSLNFTFIFLLSTGCGSGAETYWGMDSKTPYKTESESYPIDFYAIYKKTMMHSMLNDISGRDRELEAGAIYGEILNVRFGELKSRWISDYKLSLIPQISEKRLQNIISQIPEKLQKTGFAIFSPEYWRLLKKTLDQNSLEVGVIHFIPEKNINGIYSDEQYLVGIDALAVVGTLEHEIRHHTQHREVLPYPTKYVNSCVRSLDRAMGEVDAASFDLKHWVGIFESLNVDDLRIEFKEGTMPYFPQAYYFDVSVDYPTTVLNDLLSSGNCLPQMNAIIKELDQAIQGEVESIKAKVKEIVGLLSENLFEYRLIQDDSCKSASEFGCSRIVANNNRISDLKSQLKSEMQVAIETRYQKTKEILAQLPEDNRLYMEKYIPGARFLINGVESL